MQLHEMSRDQLIAIIQDYQEMVSELEAIANDESVRLFVREAIRKAIYRESVSFTDFQWLTMAFRQAGILFAIRERGGITYLFLTNRERFRKDIELGDLDYYLERDSFLEFDSDGKLASYEDLL